MQMREFENGDSPFVETCLLYPKIRYIGMWERLDENFDRYFGSIEHKIFVEL